MSVHNRSSGDGEILKLTAQTAVYNVLFISSLSVWEIFAYDLIYIEVLVSGIAIVEVSVSPSYWQMQTNSSYPGNTVDR